MTGFCCLKLTFGGDKAEAAVGPKVAHSEAWFFAIHFLVDVGRGAKIQFLAVKWSDVNH